MKHASIISVFAAFVAIWVAACEDDEKEKQEQDTTPEEGYSPDIAPADFVAGISNPFFPLTPGEKWLYEADTEDGFEQIIVEVLVETREVWGVEATVVRDTVYVDGELAEDTWDWYAEDRDGNVWYLGEETYEYEDDKIVSTEGAWETGVDGALPGIVMPASPVVGDPYYQEYLEGEAEDRGQIVEVDVSVSVPAGDFEGCIKTHDTTPLDPEVSEFKYYCPGVGVVLEEEETRVELISHDDEGYSPGVTADDFSDGAGNPYFPLTVGATWVYEATTAEGTERVEMEVLAETKDVWGVTAQVVRDTAYLDDEVIEDTWDWFAPDSDGNVWYLGEDTYEYEDGEVVSNAGAWEAGVDGALPGMVMPASPAVGDVFHQEYYIGEAEDMGEVVSLDETVSVPAGEFTGCIKTRDFSAIDPTANELKYWCEEVGLVMVEEGDGIVELIEYSGL
jgi:hypothetical protein